MRFLALATEMIALFPWCVDSSGLRLQGKKRETTFATSKDSLMTTDQLAPNGNRSFSSTQCYPDGFACNTLSACCSGYCGDVGGSYDYSLRCMPRSTTINSAQTGQCAPGYTLVSGSLANIGNCKGTVAPGYCVLWDSQATERCNEMPTCTGVSQTKNAGWLKRYPGMQSPGTGAVSPNADWMTCLKINS